MAEAITALNFNSYRNQSVTDWQLENRRKRSNKNLGSFQEYKNQQKDDLLIKKQLTQIRKFANRNIWRIEDREDFIQDAILILLENLKSNKIKNKNSISSYIKGICQRLLLVYIRNSSNKSKRSINLDDIEIEVFAEKIDRRLEIEIKQTCLEVLKGLKVKRDQEILLDFYINEKEKPEMLDKYGFKEEHLYRVLHRAKQRARKVLITC